MAEFVKEGGTDLEALLKSLDADLDEIATLAKSVLQSQPVAKADDEEGEEGDADALPDQAQDLVHAADEGGDTDTLEAYAQKLSEEELNSILTALMDEYDARTGEPNESGIPQEAAQDVQEAPQEAQEGQEGQDQVGNPEDMEKMGGLPPPGIGGAGMVDPMLGKEGDLPPETDPMADPMGGGAPEGDMGMDPGMGAEGDMMPPEGDMGGEAPMSEQEILQAVSELSPEERQRLINALQNVEAGVAQKSLKLPAKALSDKEADGGEEKSSVALAKSLEAISARLTKIEKANQELLRKSAVKPSVPSTPKEDRPVRKYADVNSQVKVLEKSENNESKLSGMELANWLIAEQRKGNRLVKSILVTRANLAKSEEDVTGLYKELNTLGILPPRK